MTREEAIRLLKSYLDEEIHTRGCIDAHRMAIKALEQEPCEDAISRKSLKQKLQEHHDFFVNAYGGFSNLSRNDKSRVDEISNCIAMVVNEPPVLPQQKIGYWLRWYERKETEQYRENIPHCNCSECGKEYDPHSSQFIKFCSNCGAKMVEP